MLFPLVQVLKVLKHIVWSAAGEEVYVPICIQICFSYSIIAHAPLILIGLANPYICALVTSGTMPTAGLCICVTGSTVLRDNPTRQQPNLR